MAIDFDKAFDEYTSSGSSSSVVNAIHEIIPSLDDKQQQILLVLNYYVKKYDLPELNEFIENFKEMMRKNKNLNFLRSMNFKSILKAWSLEEQVKGIRISSNSSNEVN
jgi:hypothetical protein